MDTIIIFLLTIVLITYLTTRHHISPFLALIIASVFYGVLAGMGEEVVHGMTSGAGNIFSLLGILIFCGATIAQVLKYGHFLERIVLDLQKIVKRPSLAAGIGGYLLSIPMMCCITAYIVLSTLIENLPVAPSVRKRSFYLAAFGSTVSFVLILPLPVAYTIVRTADLPLDLWTLNAITIPLSFVLLLGGYLLIGHRYTTADAWDSDFLRYDEKDRTKGDDGATIPRWKAWAPLYVPIFLIITGYLIKTFWFLSNINIVMLTATIVSLLLIDKDTRQKALDKGTRHAGIILLDLCGAGALGQVIAVSPFAEHVYTLMEGTLPVVFVPFVLASLIQTAQGSRVVTAVVSSMIITATPITLPPLVFVLMIVAGTLVVSYVSDPFFWLVKRTTGDDTSTVVSNYTLPLAAAGVTIFLISLIIYQVG